MATSATRTDPASIETIINSVISSSSPPFTRTATRVLEPVFNAYTRGPNQPGLYAYFTDWGQYDGRLDKQLKDDPRYAGRGYNLGTLDPCTYDKIIFSFLGIVGDTGEKAAIIQDAATKFNKQDNETTFLDSWGDIQAWQNTGLSQTGWDGWKIGDDTNYPDRSFDKSMVQNRLPENANPRSYGMLAGLYKLQQQAKEKNHTLELAFSIGGWTMSGPFSLIARNRSKRQTLIDSIIDVFTRFDCFSEVSLDWEYPGVRDDSRPGYHWDPQDGNNFVLLVTELKDTLRKKGLQNKKVSIATSAVPAHMAQSNLKALSDAGVDEFHIMTYDFFGNPWAPKLAHHSNLKSPSPEENSIEKAVKYLLETEGVPANKICVGMATYTRNAKNPTVSTISPLAGNYEKSTVPIAGSFESGSFEAPDVLAHLTDFQGTPDGQEIGRLGFTLYTDTKADADFLYRSPIKEGETTIVPGYFISVNTPRTTRVISEYVLVEGLKAVFFWTGEEKGVYTNAAREGLGHTKVSQRIDMTPFYRSGKTALASQEENSPDTFQSPPPPISFFSARQIPQAPEDNNTASLALAA
jgi:GH18 family chitinase